MGSNPLNLRRSRSKPIGNTYANEHSSFLTFHFEPAQDQDSLSRIEKAKVMHMDVDGKDLYILDDLFLEPEQDEIRKVFETASYSRYSYGSPESIERGEKPGRSMNNQERWMFFSKPPNVIEKIYNLFSLVANELNVDIMTLPWELCSQSTGSPAVIANYHEEITAESMKLGRHRDCHPKEGVLFGIPVLYEEKDALHTQIFTNGAKGKPWMVSFMLYATAENFDPKYQMGTVFYYEDGKEAFRAECKTGRIVLFEGDILHSTELSSLPKDKKTWRTSYVFKLILNPKNPDQSPKEAFRNFILTT